MVRQAATLGASAFQKELRKVVLAGVGAAVLARDGAMDVARRCLAKGQAAEPELRKAFKSMMARRKKVLDAADRLGTKAESGFKKVIEALPLVTKHDLAGLARRIDALTRKVESLGKGSKRTK